MIYIPSEASPHPAKPAACQSRGSADPIDDPYDPKPALLARSQPSDHPPMLPDPCAHLAAYCDGAARPLRCLRCCLRPRPPGRAEVRRDPHEVPRCGPCAEAGSLGTGPRLYACLACCTVLCPAHAPPHASAAGHEIALDVDRAELFCLACGDQVYDREFDAAVVLALSSPTPSSASSSPPPPDAARKRRRVEFRPWVPDPRERDVIGRGSSPLAASASGSASSSGSAWGLRGLNNLGSTCFMNSVLQALLHAPPMRNYFLSDRHGRYACRQRGRRARSGGGVDKGACLACDLDAIYSAAFSGDRKPYSPAKFLYSWWQHASNLASYEQQDAHEFFISMLDGIHEKVVEDLRKPHIQGSGDCCIAHRVFSGVLRSDVTCTICGFTSTTYDPCVDISLDLDCGQSSTKAASSRSQASNGDTESISSSQNCGMSTLRGCLERFTRSERLGSDQKLFCQNCQVRQESLKQMSIRKLPLVTCFHIKRFEHSHIRKMSRKVDRYLQFPFSLNMAPYLSSAILRSRFGNRIFSFDCEGADASTELASEFELFAVITHSGKLDAGHYITFLRLDNQWYKCDDAWITHVNESIVRASQAYMLFYVQKMLYYKASESMVPS